MKFSQMPYTRPDIDRLLTELDQLTLSAQNAANDSQILSTFSSYQILVKKLSTAGSLAYIRHTVDTADEMYDVENSFFDQQGPVLQEAQLRFYRAVLSSPHREALAKKYGDILLVKIELKTKTSDERLVPLQQAENELTSRYDKIYASARIPFQGETLTVSQLMPYKQSVDREVRRAAIAAEGAFFDRHQEELDDIYDQLVKNRTEQAKLLGFSTFTTLGDIRMQRIGYGRKEIAAYRDAVVQYVVPIVQKLKDKQAKRIGVEKLHFCDERLSFSDGNPTPKGTPEEILAAGQEMYSELSPETAEFIDFMMENELFDVLSKPGKAPGGYCTKLPEYDAPFIYSNFNGTAGDVDVLTHEAGHAFAAYRAMRKDLPAELISPSLESCEIHSMAMEFLTADYHHLFFKGDIEKYSFAHAEDALIFLPYGCLVDEFQEQVYANPELTPKERNDLWFSLERKYRPWNDFTDLPFYGRGAGWQRQLHIYNIPFYYIDYVLAQAIAIEFFLLSIEDMNSAWQRYLTLLEKAGTASYTALVESAGFQTPFTEGMIKQVAEKMYAWLEQAEPKA